MSEVDVRAGRLIRHFVLNKTADITAILTTPWDYGDFFVVLCKLLSTEIVRLDYSNPASFARLLFIGIW